MIFYRRTRHQNIIQLIEVYEGVDKIYMVLELATGKELFERIISDAFDEQEAVRAIKMVLQGLTYLHNLGIAHRDLKPENLLYSHDGKPLILIKLLRFFREPILVNIITRRPYRQIVFCIMYTSKFVIWIFVFSMSTRSPVADVLN